ncbi:hypothetical protein JTB14_007870 [Gonioctena quinquepunctata]|nr:hypothetical protein JTB14_007870 [Gonioctena quinquepunctata]
MEEIHVHNYLLIFLIGSLTFWYVQFLWRRRNLYIYSRNVKGPFAFPLIGCAYLFLGNGNELMKTLLEIQRKSPGLTKIWLGPKLVYVVSEPEHIQIILNHPKAIEKDSMYRFLETILGCGLLTAPAKVWRCHRKIIAPSFNQRVLDSFVEIFAVQSTILVEQLKSVVGQKKFNLYSFASKCTLDIICQTAMGVDMNIQRGEGKFGEILEAIMEVATFLIFRVWYHLDFIWSLAPMKRRYQKYADEFQDVTGAVVAKKMAEYNKKMALKHSCLEAEIEEGPTEKRLAFLDLILENSDLTEKELREEVNIFLAAGTETTAASMCCLFTMLGMHPEVQQKVYEEVIDIVGTDRMVIASDLPKMKYTERVIRETLRLFPIAAVFARTLGEDIDIGEFILPAGSSVAFGSVYIHRNPKYWPDPLKFDPDRFLPAEISKRHPCTYIPFSYGPRNCIGWRYALANMKTLISTVVRHYKIFTEYKSVEEINLKINLLLRMEDGPKVWIEHR